MTPFPVYNGNNKRSSRRRREEDGGRNKGETERAKGSRVGLRFRPRRPPGLPSPEPRIPRLRLLITYHKSLSSQREDEMHQMFQNRLKGGIYSSSSVASSCDAWDDAELSSSSGGGRRGCADAQWTQERRVFTPSRINKR